MISSTAGRALLLFTCIAVAAPPVAQDGLDVSQHVLTTTPTDSLTHGRKLKGRFLHITDIHPDPFYHTRTDSDGSHPCHGGEDDGKTGHFGAPVTGCDAPFTLVNATFQWIQDHIRDDIDFVLWTGDSARHDNDEDYPRSDKQVKYLNNYVVQKFMETFGRNHPVHRPHGNNDFVVPIVPTFGNNDVLPHNIFEAGPNRWTRSYLDIWHQFVPEAQKHSFARGGWFFTEVIPGKLAVISLNTLYFFENNSATDGCDIKTEPGYEHMEWLRIQLQFFRQRGMKAIIIGHVPPARTDSKQNWDETCYQKLTLWLRQYRDVIVGSVYGHMNIDHFMLQDVHDLDYNFDIPGVDGETSPTPRHHLYKPLDPDTLHTAVKPIYLNELRKSWARLPTPPKGVFDWPAEVLEDDANTTKKKSAKDKFLKKIGGPWAERFSVSLVSPSVVPNYFPTLRIVEYNITGLEGSHPARGSPQGTPASEHDLATSLSGCESGSECILDAHGDGLSLEDEINSSKKKGKKGRKGRKSRKGRTRKPKFPIPAPPSKASPPGPAYSPQTFTFLSYTQLYANLTQIHQEMDGLAAPARDAAEQYGTAFHNASETVAPFQYQVEYTTKDDAVYQMPDLTMRSWLDLAERIGRETYRASIEGQEAKGQKHKNKGKLKKNHIWHAFVRRAFVESKAEQQLEEDFG